MTALVQAKAEPSISHALPAFNACLPARMVDDLSNAFPRRIYHRLYSPLVIVWCLIFQRLNADHTCDAVVSHLGSGAVDCLSSRHRVPLSLRMKSESTAAYCKARKRLPIQIVEGVLAYLADTAGAYLAVEALWKGHSVALLDGSTIILRPEAELVEAYGQARNQHGSGYWVTMRVVGAFCLATGAVLAVKEAAHRVSEQILAKTVMAQLPPSTVVVGDRNFGVFSVAQAARQYGHQVILRMTSIRAMALAGRKMQTGEEITVRWIPARRVMFHAEMSQEPVEGRLIYKRLHPDGFRTIDLYLFTSLVDASRYKTDELVSLYGKRWNVELDLRYVKQTLDMAMLTSKSKDMVRKELSAGMCAYNLVRICMVQAGRTLMTVPRLLSFAKCRRRISECIRSLARGTAQVQALTILRTRLEGCFAQKRTRFRIEPRAVRRFPAVYPALKGSRAAARAAALNSYHATSKS